MALTPPAQGRSQDLILGELLFGIGIGGVADVSRTRHLRSHNPVLYLMSYGHRHLMLKTAIDHLSL